MKDSSPPDKLSDIATYASKQDCELLDVGFLDIFPGKGEEGHDGGWFL